MHSLQGSAPEADRTTDSTRGQSWSDIDRPAAERAQSTTESPWGFGEFWRLVRGSIFTVVVVAAAYLLSRVASPSPDLAPIFVLVVVAITVIDGTRSAVISGVVFVGYFAYSISPAHPFTFSRADAVRLAIFSVVTLTTPILAGVPLRRASHYRRELLAERQRLSEALKAKGEFMNAAAHQLRTPLTVIGGYVSMLQDETFGRLPDRFHTPIDAMQRKAREVTGLIDEMLLVSRVQRGTAPAASMPVDLREAVRKAVERAEPQVTLEQATLSFELPATPVEAQVDPDHLAHILDNLISNALTYTDGRPWVKITVTGGDDARVIVKDRGWGVAEGIRQKIFDGFIHDVNPENQPKSGKGLGLAVSRDLAERYGGSLDLVRTDPGRGSVFVLRLPAAQ